ncbi:MAG: hypothetical protein ACOC3I_02420 [Verrucomicrobiota bacterium]
MPTLYLRESSIRDEEFITFLNEQGISYRERLVDESGRDQDGEEVPAEVKNGPLPVMTWDGTTLTDVSVDQLKKVLHERGHSFEDS